MNLLFLALVVHSGEKWMLFPGMDYHVVSSYDRMCNDLTGYGFSKTCLHFEVPHLKIELIKLCVLSEFLNHCIFLKFI